MKRIQTSEMMSQVISHGGIAYLSGQVALGNPNADTQGQTEEVLGRIDALLEEAGSDKSHLLSATIWIADVGDFADMNEVWINWLPEGKAPVRATVGADLALPGLRVEIQVTALLKEPPLITGNDG